MTHAGLRAADLRPGRRPSTADRAARAIARADAHRAAPARGRRRRVHRHARPDEPGGFIVRGEKPERWVRQTAFDNDEAVGYLADRLARLGVEDELAKLGRRARRRGHHRRRHLRLRADRRRGRGRLRCPRRRGADDRLDTSTRPARRRAARGQEAAGHVDRRAGPARRATSVGYDSTNDPRGRSPAARAHRRQGRVVVAHRGRPARPGPARRDRRRARGARVAAGQQVVLVSSGAIAAGIGPLGLTRPPARPRHPAGRGQRRAAAARRALRRLVRPLRPAASGRCCSPPTTCTGAGTTATPSAPWSGCSPRASSRSSTRTTPSPPTRSASATTTGSPRWSPTSCRPTRWCCSPTSTASTPASPAVPGSRVHRRGRRRWPSSRASDVSGSGSHVGSGGMATKIDAAAIATSEGIPVLLAAATRIGDGAGRRRPARSSTPPATAARRGCSGCGTPPPRAAGWCSTPARWPRWSQRRTSLLPAGITAVDGEFDSGDPVELVGPDGVGVARGLVGYDAADLPAAARAQDPRPAGGVPPRGRAPRRPGPALTREPPGRLARAVA